MDADPLQLRPGWRVGLGGGPPRGGEPAAQVPAELPARAGSDGGALGTGGMGETTAELFERAVRLHSRRLLAIARAVAGNRASAEDVVQQALMNLFQHRERYDWHEPGGLLRRAVVNEALRILRQPRMSAVADDLAEPDRGRGAGGYGECRHRDGNNEPVGGMIDRETVQRVRQAIDRLPEHFRAALVLCEYEGMSYVQIAEVLSASVPQVKTWLHRGRKQLAELLKDFVGREPKGPQWTRKRPGVETQEAADAVGVESDAGEGAGPGSDHDAGDGPAGEGAEP